MLTPLQAGSRLSGEFVRYCLEQLSALGYAEVVTGALSPFEQTGFLEEGFTTVEDLVLLGLDLREGLPEPEDGPRLRRVGVRRRADVLHVDGAAFPEFWRFDDLALADALAATPVARFRAARGGGGGRGGRGGRTRRQPAGYAICGRSGMRGYVQRLAVHPEAQGQGLGRRLLLDGLHWMQRGGAWAASVNTQLDNSSALALYQSVGFREEDFGLSVLTAPLP